MILLKPNYYISHSVQYVSMGTTETYGACSNFPGGQSLLLDKKLPSEIVAYTFSFLQTVTGGSDGGVEQVAKVY